MKSTEVIKKLRKLTGLTQLEFAKKVNLDDTRISKYEKGTHEISLQMFLDWCEILDFDPKEIFK